MSGIVIAPKSNSEKKFINDLLDKLNISTTSISSSDMEDLGLSIAMRESDRTKKVSKSAVMKKLLS